MKNPLLSLLLSLIAFTARAQYSIEWSTIDGGGGTSTNGQYSLSGTIGQPDAGATMTGGTYSLNGGFWGLLAAVQTPGAPTLTITLNPQFSTITISWPSPSTGFGLEQSDSLTAPIWTSVGATPVDNGPTRSVTVPADPGNNYYRLKKP
jgi:hypothetical protein